MVERSIVRVDGMKKLISDLLDLTRIESGQRERSIRRLDLPELARGSIELFAGDAARRGVTVTLGTPDDVELWADPGEVEIVLNNLVSNAIKYNREGGTVNVTLARRDGGVEIAVADTGIGLKPEEAAKLFREFTRIKNEHTVKVLDGAQDRHDVRGRDAGDERVRGRQHLHRDAQGRAAVGGDRRARLTGRPERSSRSSRAALATGPLVTPCTRRPDTGESRPIEAVVDRGVRGSTCPDQA
jgi:hypothetical protein